jgi:hypothetical protein
MMKAAIYPNQRYNEGMPYDFNLWCVTYVIQDTSILNNTFQDNLKVVTLFSAGRKILISYHYESSVSTLLLGQK